jgi:pimeloyl-ACP methyl ester carboxylesterase
MNSNLFDEIYNHVPQDQRTLFKKFRSAHTYTELPVNSVVWKYLSCGKGEPVLLLPGGIRSAETWFKLITALENEYRIISPTYPAVPTMKDITTGIFALVESEQINKAHMLGTSFGGWVAQCFVREYPDTVKTLILSNTSGPGGISRRLIRYAQIVTSVSPTWLIRIAFRRNYFNILSVADQEREFWKAFLKELSLVTTKNDIASQQKCSLDFVNCRFSRNDLANWPGRILILESDDDPAFKVSVREALKTLYPQADVHTFHNAGHTPGYTNPLEYSGVVKAFLNKEQVM